MNRWDLIREIRLGLVPEWRFFWGHVPANTDVLDDACLSQWWQYHSFRVNGELYFTAEHYMMAEKARLFGDEKMRRRILCSEKPSTAKELGRLVSGFQEDVWLEHRQRVVQEGSYHKFAAHEDLRRHLFGTGQSILVEASPRDLIWGIGLRAHDQNATNPRLWRGMNLLGFALMDAREKLRGIPPAPPP